MTILVSNRNVRLIVAIIGTFFIIAFFASQQGSLSNSIQRVKPAKSGDEDLLSNFDEEPKNTLQGTTPHKAGKEAPYAQANKNPSAITDPLSQSPQQHHADDAISPPKPNTKPGQKVYADKSKSKPSVDSNSNTPISNNVEAPKKNPSSDLTSGDDCKSVDYVIMIDAGSTGSRIHVYEFDTCKSPPALLNEHFKMLDGGLSSYDTDVKGAAASLDPLLKVALEKIPADKQGCTPVAVKATAGLRLLGKEKSDNILEEVRTHLENDYPFAVVDGDGISIMDGKDEGVYAWITTNYLLGNIGNEEQNPTAAVFDLGGGSTQIVFEPEFNNNEEMVDGEHKYDLTFGNRKFSLYQFSHLGFGLMQGRNKINSLVLESHLKTNTELQSSKVTSKKEAKAAKASVTINNPCIAVGVTAENVLVEISDKEFYVVNFKGPSSPAGAQCRFLAEKVLNKESECTTKPCSFNGVHQPSLTKTFRKSSDMYVFSYFYDRTNPLGFPSSFTVEELTELAKVVCNGEQLWKDVLLDDHIKGLNEEPQWCLDLSFITAMLHTGYDIPLHRELRTAKKIDNNELGWCLGASLPLLDKTTSGWKCKVKDTTSKEGSGSAKDFKERNEKEVKEAAPSPEPKSA